MIDSDIHERKATCLGIRSGQSAVGVHSHTIISSDLGYQAQNDIATSRHVSDRDFRPEQGSTEPEHFSSNLRRNDEWRQQSSKGHRTVDQRLAHASGQWHGTPSSHHGSGLGNSTLRHGSGRGTPNLQVPPSTPQGNGSTGSGETERNPSPGTLTTLLHSAASTQNTQR